MLGYKIVDGEVEVDREEERKILDIFIEYKAGKSLRLLAKEYGFKTNHSSIKRILQNKSM